MSDSNRTREGQFSAGDLRKICLEVGVDDAGFVNIGREGLEKEREGILRVYPSTRSIISVIKVMNRENIQSPARYVSNDEYHSVGDEFTGICREILRRLNKMGVRGVVSTQSWPMDLNRWPGKIWDVSHKILAIEAGLGQMGMSRILLHPEYGAFIQLNSILIDAEMDEYGRPLAENPCIKCHLCASVCPTGAISKDEPFDFSACSTHCYRDNVIGFQDWVEAIITSKDFANYRSRFNDSETAFMWQSLMFRMSYRCSYCVSVCPAGGEVKSLYLQDKGAYIEQVLKPLQYRAEPVYVTAGSKAELAAKRNPHKEIKRVRGGESIRVEGFSRSKPQEEGKVKDMGLLMSGMAATFNSQAAGNLKATIQFEVTGKQPGDWFFSIENGRCSCHEGKANSPNLTIQTPSEVWLAISNSELDGQQAFMDGKYSVRGDIGLLMRMRNLFGDAK